ncbi:MAG: hypothetical protein RLZZ381_3035 [Cyanobacteriota bacterium]|jgi:hypothetical protein
MVFIFSIIKGKLISNPERSLTEAYQVAIKIKSWEQKYFEVERSRDLVDERQNDTLNFIQEDIGHKFEAVCHVCV